MVTNALPAGAGSDREAAEISGLLVLEEGLGWSQAEEAEGKGLGGAGRVEDL